MSDLSIGNTKQPDGIHYVGYMVHTIPNLIVVVLTSNYFRPTVVTPSLHGCYTVQITLQTVNTDRHDGLTTIKVRQ